MQVIVALSAEAFGDWEKSSFAPETAFLDQVKAISGISSVETQTYTLMTMWSNCNIRIRKLKESTAMGWWIVPVDIP